MRPLAVISPLIIFGALSGSILLAYAFTHPQIPKTVVTIPEGATVQDINKLLRERGVLTEGLPQSLEGYLFPDTYEFFAPSATETVKAKFEENFNRKVRTIIPAGLNEDDLEELLIKASLVEREVSDPSDRKIVAGIMLKRLENNMPLQMDASLCYIKSHLTADGQSSCLPITESDKKVNSPFNTYENFGLPPEPIANPGLDAIAAVLDPTPTPYWFYLSEPESKKTVFSKTLDEHNRNIVKYLNTTN